MIRIGIYLLGAAVVLFVIHQNTFKTVSKSFTFEESYSRHQALFMMPTFQDFNNIEINIEFNREADLDQFQAKTTRTMMVLQRERRNIITEPDELRKKLFEEGQPLPNGSFVEYWNTVYFIEGGRMLPFTSPEALRQLGFRKNEIKSIDKQTFDQFEIDDEIDQKDDPAGDFPKNLIIKAGSDFFLTGSKNIYPISSENVITKIWNDFEYVETGSIRQSELYDAQCMIMDPKNVICHSDMKKANKITGDGYLILLLGIPNDAIENVNVNLKRSANVKSVIGNIRKLVW